LRLLLILCKFAAKQVKITVINSFIMKNILNKYIPVVAIFFASPTMFHVMPASASIQQVSKAAKKEAKQLVKDGWKVWGSSQSMEQALDAHYVALTNGGTEAFAVLGHGLSRSLNVAVSKAKNDATKQYASMKETKVDVMVDTRITNEAGSDANSNIKLDATSRSQVSQNVKNFKPTVIIMRQLPDGSYEAQAYYVVSE